MDRRCIHTAALAGQSNFEIQMFQAQLFNFCVPLVLKLVSLHRPIHGFPPPHQVKPQIIMDAFLKQAIADAKTFDFARKVFNYSPCNRPIPSPFLIEQCCGCGFIRFPDSFRRFRYTWKEMGELCEFCSQICRKRVWPVEPVYKCWACGVLQNFWKGLIQCKIRSYRAE